MTKPATSSLNALSSALSTDGDGEPIDPVDLQEDLLRYADNLTSAATNATERLQRDGKALQREELLRIRIFLGWEILTSATGSNALGNLVDLLILSTAGRMRIEDYWMPKVYGNSAETILSAFRTRERMIWRIARAVIRPDQQAELMSALNQWRQHRSREPSPMPMFANIALIEEVTKASEPKQGSFASSVFALLDLDPLAGLDPATRELAQTRLFAERALFIGQRMPQIMQWQAELLALEAGQVPEVKELVANTTRFATAGERLTQVIEQTPKLLSSEREKIIAALRSQQQGLTTLSKELTSLLTQGTKMASATNEALRTFDQVATGLKSTSKKDNSASEPFRIKDYAETAAEIARMSQQLQQLLATVQPSLDPKTFAALSTEADAIASRAEARGVAIINHAYRMAIQWVALSALIVLGAGLTYKYLGAQIANRTRHQV